MRDHHLSGYNKRDENEVESYIDTIMKCKQADELTLDHRWMSETVKVNEMMMEENRKAMMGGKEQGVAI
jgi:hypothetical protein